MSASPPDVPDSAPARGQAVDSVPASASPAPSPTGRAVYKSCDACKLRKVRCPNADFPNPCRNCLRRNDTCHFGTKRVPRRDVTKHLRLVPGQAQGHASPPGILRYADDPLNDAPDRPDDTPSLHVDYMLAHVQAHVSAQPQAQPQAQTPSRPHRTPHAKGNGIFGGSYSLTFFSEARLASLARRLRNSKVNDLVRRINGIISGRLRRTDGLDASASASASASAFSLAMADPVCFHPAPALAAACIRSYFDCVHPLYPFLDRAAFEARALPPDRAMLDESLGRSKAWSALYHSVLAIGCVVGDGDDKDRPIKNGFEPGKGTAWRLFSVALASLSDLMILPDSLLTLQALTAMVIYSLGVSCLSFERVLLAEAARRAQSLASSHVHAPSSGCATFQRTFWVLYGIEKIMSFHFGRTSSFVDADIACPLPPDWRSDTWMFLLVRHARLLSRTYTSLFSIGTPRPAPEHTLALIDRLCHDAEQWRSAIPDAKGLRPDGASTSSTTSTTSTTRASPALRSPNYSERTIALALRYLYSSLVVILARAKMHHLSLVGRSARQHEHDAAQRALMVSARSILELTPAIDVEPHTPLWVLAVVPLTALFVLFDLVIDAPLMRSETPLNLALLDMGAGYFSRIEYASGSSLPGSLISEFAHIARDYVNECQRRAGQAETDRADQTDRERERAQQPLPMAPALQAPPVQPLAQPDPLQPALQPALQPLHPAGDTLWPSVDLDAMYDYSHGDSLLSDPDFSGTDVMRLFTSNFFLSEMEGILPVTL